MSWGSLVSLCLPVTLNTDLFPASFGIGTFLTNDFNTVSSGWTEKSKALNMVIKIADIDGKPCVKISDDIDKVGEGCYIRWTGMKRTGQ